MSDVSSPEKVPAEQSAGALAAGTDLATWQSEMAALQEVYSAWRRQWREMNVRPLTPLEQRKKGRPS